MRLCVAWALPLLAVPVALAGCLSGGSPTAGFSLEARASNDGAAAATVLLKAWDHNGALVLNRTAMVDPGATVSFGTVTGDIPPYGAPYTWFAQSDPSQHQEQRSPAGLATWTVDVGAGGITFAFD